MVPTCTDYALPVKWADTLKGVVGLPKDIRVQALNLFRRSHGTEALVELFAEFIGLANSVVENNREMIELFVITDCDVHPHRAHEVNLPTIFGALCGVGVAARVAAKSVCASCAFKLGTPPNQSPITAIDALDAADGEGDFMCHHDVDDAGNPTHLCRGYAVARAELRAEEVA